MEATDHNCTSRMLRDAEFFKSRISKIDGAGDIGGYLFNIVNVKAVAEAPKVPDEPPTKVDDPAESSETADAEGKT